MPGTFHLVTAHTFPHISPLSRSRIADLVLLNRGGVGEEVVDDQFNFTNARRRSNSSGYYDGKIDFKTKFEFNEPEPVFEENLHGPEPGDDELVKTETASSGSSLDEEKSAKSV